MSNGLLEVVRFDDAVKRTRKGNVAPLLMELAVNPDLAPFLVSSMRSVQWVPKASEDGRVRAAVRKRQGLEAEILAAILQMGQESEWGNVHPLTTEGLEACVEHLIYYELKDLEILVAPDTELTNVELPAGFSKIDAPWVPQGAVVVVPTDRNYLGMLGVIGQHKAIAVVHNASRGAAIAWR